MPETLVKVEKVSKKFCRSLKRSMWYGIKDLGTELLGRSQNHNCLPPLRKDEFLALNDVSFELKRGDCLGLIGRNGAGKSTLLKMLNGLIKPDSGRIEMRGRIGALIELGTGFNPVLSGRENIYINGSLLGFSKAEIDQKYDSIVEFAEIGEFIDMPVQSYSSGMKVRLGFSVAAQMEPDILLIDEVLAVGDVGFRVKCYNEIYRIMEHAAVIFVSHSMPQVGKVCTRGMLLSNGTSKFQSRNIAEVMGAYYNLFSGENLRIEGSGKAHLKELVFGNYGNPVRVTSFENLNSSHVYTLNIVEPVYLRLAVTIDQSIDYFFVLYSISDVDQKTVAQMMSPSPLINNGNNVQIVQANLSNLLLNTGKYTLAFHVIGESSADRGEILLGIRNIIKFSVLREKFIGTAPILYNANWRLTDEAEAG